MNYTLNNTPKSNNSLAGLGALWSIVSEEKRVLGFAFVALILNSACNLVAPLLIGHAIDTYMQAGAYGGILQTGALLLGVYLCALVVGYLQTNMMGSVAQRMLFRLRNLLFEKLLALPIAFFNQNKAGDLISRINNDTEKINQFFSQSLMQFLGNLFIMIGAALFLLFIHPVLGLAALAPAMVLVLFTQFLSPWIKRKNTASLQTIGSMSAEIQESLNNFKVIIAFNRRDYFRARFQEVNENNYKSAMGAGIANNLFTPIYGFSAQIAQLVVLLLGINFIAAGEFSVGLLISFIVYVTNFYNPLRQIAALWANLQVALAGWDRVSEILELTSDIETLPALHSESNTAPLLEFRGIHFRYPDGQEVLHDINFALESGKTYALVGPTGGGKTTTASLMARLYDPTQGTVLLEGKDIRSFTPEQRSSTIGFILQEPYLFAGSLRDNIVYGHPVYAKLSTPEVLAMLEQERLAPLLQRFPQGLDTNLKGSGEEISLGQRQLIAFMRAILRKPKLLILDEATANIDTVTEQLLEDIIKTLPAHTTKVIIAHRLNTIESADGIFFVGGGSITHAGSLSHAMELLLHTD